MNKVKYKIKTKLRTNDISKRLESDLFWIDRDIKNNKNLSRPISNIKDLKKQLPSI